MKKTRERNNSTLVRSQVKALLTRSPEIIEAEIAELEKRIADLSKKMSEPEVARDITRLVEVNDAYQQAETRLAELMDEWERAETTRVSYRR